MKNDAFEIRLQEQRLRQIPPEWRGEILAAAKAGAAVERKNPGILTQLLEMCRQLLWPSPVAWVGVAAGWLLIVTLNHSPALPHSRPAAPQLSVKLADYVAAVAYQRRLESELTDSTARIEITPPRTTPAVRPQSRLTVSATEEYA